jgi:hypothetical protein
MPRLWALAFIRSEKPSIEPPMLSAMVAATSFADFTSMILRALSRRIWVPGLNPILDGGRAAALSLTVRSVSMLIRPERTWSSAT